MRDPEGHCPRMQLWEGSECGLCPLTKTGVINLQGIYVGFTRETWGCFACGLRQLVWEGYNNCQEWVCAEHCDCPE